MLQTSSWRRWAVMTLSMAALVWVRDRESALLQTIIDRIRR